MNINKVWGEKKVSSKTEKGAPYTISATGLFKRLCNFSYYLYQEELPEIDLLVAVIVSAAKDRDVNYFNSVDFIYHCWLLGLNYITVRSIIIQIWERIEEVND